MFRSRSKTPQRGNEPPPVSSHYETIKEPKTSSKGNWKPSLRKLFSKKDSSKESERQHELGGYSALSSNTRDTTAQGIKEPVAMPTERPRDVEISNPGYEIQKSLEIQRSPHEQRDPSKRRSFIQRTLAKKKSNPDPDHQSFPASQEVEESGNLLHEYHDDVVKTAAYVPTHAATDLYNCTRHKTTELTRPTSIVCSATATIRLVPSDTRSDDETADFQAFLRESRITEARNREKRASRRYSSLPTTAQVTDGIMANRQTSEVRQGSSVSQGTVALKASRRRSIAVSIGEYIKPSRPHTMYGAPPLPSWADASDRKSANGNMYSTTGGEDHSRLSRFGMSRDRDRENDERTETARNLRPKQLKRNSLAPPTGNPSLNRYNQGVREKKGTWV